VSPLKGIYGQSPGGGRTWRGQHAGGQYGLRGPADPILEVVAALEVKGGVPRRPGGGSLAGQGEHGDG